MVRNRKKFTAGKIVILFIAGMFLMLLLIAGITTLIDISTEIREVNLVTWYGVVRTSVKINSPNETALPYYDNIKISMQVFYQKEPSSEDDRPSTPPIMDELIFFDGDDSVFALYIVGSKNIPYLQSFFFRKNEDKISYPLYRCQQDIVAYWSNKGIFHDEDRVARDIVRSYANDFSARVNNGNILYYGVGLDAKLKNLTILGYTPTEVIPFEYNKQTYYFWYYLEDVPFTKILETTGVLHADIHDSPLGGLSGSFQFTTGDIIDCLEITFSDD